MTNLKTEFLKRRTEHAPKVTGRGSFLSFAEDIPSLRFYFHQSGSGLFRDSDLLGGYAHLMNLVLINKNPNLTKGCNYLIAVLWGCDNDKMVDLFGYSGLDLKNWPGNPEVSSYIFKDGVYLPKNKAISCGDGLIILGEEERYRRTTKSLEDYIKNPPKIPGLVRR